MDRCVVAGVPGWGLYSSHHLRPYSWISQRVARGQKHPRTSSQRRTHSTEGRKDSRKAERYFASDTPVDKNACFHFQHLGSHIRIIVWSRYSSLHCKNSSAQVWTKFFPCRSCHRSGTCSRNCR